MSIDDSQHAVTLESGEVVRFRSATPDDYPELSRMIQDNFANAANFRDLSDEARAGYIEANSLEGLREVCGHPDTLVRLVAVLQGSGEIVGFALYRRGTHLITGEEIAEGKRVQVARHMAGKGVGNALLGVVRQKLRDMGIRKIAGYTSGASMSYWEKQGRTRLLTLDNPALAKRGVKAEANYVEVLL